MKLPDFLIFDDFLRLKHAMGIPSQKLGNVRAIEIKRVGATREEIRKLAEEGLEINVEDVVSLPDGTLSYKDRRVLLYIRDVSQYGSNYSEPKFHISDCNTLQWMRENQRFAKYVIASRDDGLFRVHYVNRNLRKDRRLQVCQNCLDRLSYEGFQRAMRQDRRRSAVQNFSISGFFALYPKTIHHYVPTHTDLTAPVNEYSLAFRHTSRAYRRSQNWTCETCGISLSAEPMRRFLHVHHKNGLKNDNDDTNLKAVCIHCHANEPLHGHMTAMLQYREFEPIWRKWQRQALYPNTGRPA